jgi:hypothetical protein
VSIQAAGEKPLKIEVDGLRISEEMKTLVAKPVEPTLHRPGGKQSGPDLATSRGNSARANSLAAHYTREDCLIAGASGLGKSQITAYLAAITSSGLAGVREKNPMPGMSSSFLPKTILPTRSALASRRARRGYRLQRIAVSRILCSPDFQAQYDVLIHESAFAARWCRARREARACERHRH